MQHVVADGEVFDAQHDGDADRLATHLINAGAQVVRVATCTGTGCERCALETIEPCIEAVEFLVARGNAGVLEKPLQTSAEAIAAGSSLGPHAIALLRASNGGTLGRYEKAVP